MITEDYVSFEIAKLLKEKGFDEPCECLYDTENNDVSIVNGWMNISNSELEEREFVCYSAPTLQMTMKWLREVHNYNIEIDTIGQKFRNTLFWRSVIYNLEHDIECYREEDFKSYEEACEAAIKYCLENLI